MGFRSTGVARAAVAAALIVAALPPPARAAARRRRAKSAALIVLSKDDPDPALSATLVQGLASIAARAPGFTFVSGDELRTRLGEDPAAAAVTCGADLGCISKLGHRAHVRQVVIARLTPGEPGLRAQFLTVGVQGAVPQARSDLEAASVGDLESRLEAVFPTLFDAQPDAVERHEGDSNEPALAGSQDLPDPDLPELPSLEMVPPEQAATAREPLPGFVLWTGVGAATAGVAVLIAGAALGAAATADASAIPADLDSPTAFEREHAINGRIDVANILLGVGGGVAGLGAGVFVLGLLAGDWLHKATPQVAVGPASAALRWTW